MATKTISIEIDAYEKLKAAKQGPHDSFSEVIRRAEFPEEALTGALLNRLSKIFAGMPDDGMSLEEALAGLPSDPIDPLSLWEASRD